MKLHRAATHANHFDDHLPNDLLSSSWDSNFVIFGGITEDMELLDDVWQATINAGELGVVVVTVVVVVWNRLRSPG